MKIELVIILILIMVWVARIEYELTKRMNNLEKRIKFLEIPEYRIEDFALEYLNDKNNVGKTYYFTNTIKTKKDLGEKIRIGNDVFFKSIISGLNVSEYTYIKKYRGDR